MNLFKFAVIPDHGNKAIAIITVDADSIDQAYKESFLWLGSKGLINHSLMDLDESPRKYCFKDIMVTRDVYTKHLQAFK